MTTIAVATASLFPAEAEAIDLHDRVRAPDGRIGSVIGFYRRAEVTVVVLFDSGDSAQFLHAQLVPLL
jgi:hypothetical protein